MVLLNVSPTGVGGEGGGEAGPALFVYNDVANG